MKLQTVAASAVTRAAHTVEDITRFARLERVLASVCLLVPVFLIWSTGGVVRESISAYYDIEQNQIFYFFLTMAAMLFIVNGVVKEKYFYNTFLGVMLAGVILFNHDDFTVVHGAFAFAFFAGNGVVILLYSSKKELWFKRLLVGGIVTAMLGFFLLDWFTLFWAEWLSFGIIALHYILESAGVID